MRSHHTRLDFTPEEKHLQVFMKFMLLSCLMYLGAGLAFLFFPELIFGLINRLSAWITPGLPPIPPSSEKFWLCLAFSMMMMITVASYAGHVDPRKRQGYIWLVVLSKFTSSFTSIAMFVFDQNHLAYAVIFMVDGTLFWLTLAFLIRANRSFILAQTVYLRDSIHAKEDEHESLVVIEKGDDKFKLLDDVLAKTDFMGVLDRKRAESGKAPADFKVVIKPNFMFMHSNKDHSSYTDPKLVEHLIKKIYLAGYTDIVLVEAQSTYGNYYRNREVKKVAAYVGYKEVHPDFQYRIVDLTEEIEPFDYGGRLGEHYVGPHWRDADFRVSFAKNKTHVFSNYTLTLKNVYGTLPCQNKLHQYHTKREYDWPTIESMKHFPVHFGLVDAFYSADGQLGVIVDPDPNPTHTMIGGENLVAVDVVGATKMGLDPYAPRVGRYLALAMEAFGKPKLKVVGDLSVYDPWENVSEFIVIPLDLIEEAYKFSNWMFAGLSAQDAYFKFKWTGWGIRLFRWLLAPVKRIWFKYDEL